MKTLFLSLIMMLTMQAQAMDITPDQLTPDQQTKLIMALNEMEPEMLEAILSREALEWYIGQFTRDGEVVEDFQEVTTDRVDSIGGFEDPNLPSFL